METQKNDNGTGRVREEVFKMNKGLRLTVSKLALRLRLTVTFTGVLVKVREKMNTKEVNTGIVGRYRYWKYKRYCKKHFVKDLHIEILPKRTEEDQWTK